MATVDPTPEFSSQQHTNLAEQLLEIIRDLALELHPGRQEIPVALETDIDRELGFDSLSRVELLIRIERDLKVQLPEHVFSAETPRDLLAEVLKVNNAGPEETIPADRSAAPAEAPKFELPTPQPTAFPDTARTLTEVLEWHARFHPDRTHVEMYSNGAEPPVAITYAGLYAGAQRVAAHLAALGLWPGQAVAIMLPTGRDYLETFFGILLAGGIPVPIYPPLRASQLQDHLQRHTRILDNAGAKILVTVKQAKTVARLLKSHLPELKQVATPEMLAQPAPAYEAVTPKPDDIALLQYTSGSTGQPKGVTLTHAQLLQNIRIMGRTIEATADDVFVSWLPLYHDMGLIGAWLGSLYIGMRAVLMPPTAFLIRPWRWLQAIHEHRGTLSPAPNFAYELCLTKIPEDKIAGLDLSCWRAALNGAEPVRPDTLVRFGDQFSHYGFNPLALLPVYGLAEVAVGLAFPPLTRGVQIDHVDRRELEHNGFAKPANPEDEDILQVVACGRPLPEYEIRIVDSAGRELPARQEGQIQFRGPSTTNGYYRNPEANTRLFDGEWLNSGDLGYLAGGDVYLTGRAKDVIIRAGRNLYPYELEEAVGDLPGIRKGCVAVFGARDHTTATDKLVVVAETREPNADGASKIHDEISALASDLLGTIPEDIILVPPQGVLKTSSGKLRRAACRELYEQGRIGEPSRPVRQQLTQLWLGAIRPQFRRWRRSLRDISYAGYLYVLFSCLFPFAMLCLLHPKLETRWSGVRFFIRALFRLAGIPLTVQGLEHFTHTGKCVVVANHASYVDGLVIVAALPSPIAFVAKGELQQKRFPHWLLNRLNASFVERFDAKQGVADAKRISERTRDPVPLMYFPEGTFTRSPGLAVFRMGAFAAAEAKLPIVPITLNGTRSILRGDSHFPHHGRIGVVIGEPIHSSQDKWAATLELRNRARQAILQYLDEPDLEPESRPREGP